jgi:hypothetical protein
MELPACSGGREGRQVRRRYRYSEQWKNKNRKKKSNNNKPLAGTAITTVADGGCGPRGDKRPRQPFGSDESGPWCPVHNSRRHSAEECWEIKKLMEQFDEQ